MHRPGRVSPSGAPSGTMPAVTIRDLEPVLSAAPIGGPRASAMAAGLVGSEILKIAADIRAKAAAGAKICNLTVGDFSPAQFRIPPALERAVVKAVEAGETNYPPSTGLPELRQAVVDLYERSFGMRFPVASVLVAGGARPCIYGAYRAVVDPGDAVVYPVPSWNNNHYCHMVGARGVEVACDRRDHFLPTKDALLEHLPSARMVCINSPLNPSGTAISEEALGGIAEAVVTENRRRARCGERPVYLLYDQIYWMLTFGDTRHTTPVELVPEVAPFTIFVDGISKAFAATGLRVGWAVGPTDVIGRMAAILGHVGAWAPRPEQRAAVALLRESAAVEAHLETFRPQVKARLDALHAGFQAMKGRGLPVDTLAPMGAIYLSVNIAPFGQVTPAGARLATNEDVRAYLLEEAGVGIVPFQAFGVAEDSGWFRLSVGAVGRSDIEAALPRIEAALSALA